MGALTDELNTHEVVSRGDAAGEGKVPPSLSGDHVVDGPLAAAETLGRDLDP